MYIDISSTAGNEALTSQGQGSLSVTLADGVATSSSLSIVERGLGMRLGGWMH